MKVIFLDIDGVLVTGETVNTLVQVNGHHYFNSFAKGAVYQLNLLLAKSDAELVISSSWRTDGLRWDALMIHFAEQGIIKVPVGRTCWLEKKLPDGSIKHAQRGAECKAWLSNDVSHYVAIDDDSDFDDIPNNFVLVRNGMWRAGLQASHVKLALAILNREI